MKRTLEQILALPDNALLGADELSTWLGVSKAWIMQHSNRARRPYLPGFKVGKEWRYVKGEVAATLERWAKGNTA